jgi:hypothetical protein
VAFTIAAAGEGRGLFVTGGHLIDADLKRAPDEPGADRFRELFPAIDFRVPLSRSVEVIEDGTNGIAIVRVHGQDGLSKTMPFLDLLGSAIVGLEFTTDYILEAGASQVRIRTEVYNPTEKTITGISAGDFLSMGNHDDLFTTEHGFVSPEPFSKTDILATRTTHVSYAYFAPGDRLVIPVAVEPGVGILHERPLVLPSRARQRYERVLAVGPTLADVLEQAFLQLNIPINSVTGEVLDPHNQGIPGALVQLMDSSNGEIRIVNETVTDATGKYRFHAPPGTYKVLCQSEGRQTVHTAAFPLETSRELTLQMAVRASVEVTLDGPAKITVRAAVSKTSAAQRVDSSDEPTDQVYYTETGTLSLPLGPGRWDIIASRGMDFELLRTTVELAPGDLQKFAGTIPRALLSSRRWLATDMHQHTVGSPDGEPTIRDKLIQNIAEGCHVAVITDHDHVSDAASAMKSLGGPLLAINGIEVSPVPEGHFNVFPVKPGSLREGNGLWVDAGIGGLLQRFSELPSRPFQVLNHPRDSGMGVFHHLRSDPYSPVAPGPFDAIEVNGSIGVTADFLADADQRIREQALSGGRTPALIDWFGWLNAGQPVTGVGVSDSHLARQGTCHPRTYVWTDRTVLDTSPDDLVRALRSQHAIVAQGLFLDVHANGERHMGHSDPLHFDARDPIRLSVQLEAPTWITSESITVFEGGRPVPFVSTRTGWRQARDGETDIHYELPAHGHERIRFEHELLVSPKTDTWYVVLARGAGNGLPVFSGKPFAYTNPIYVDIDGNGIALEQPDFIFPTDTTVANVRDYGPKTHAQH